MQLQSTAKPIVTHTQRVLVVTHCTWRISICIAILAIDLTLKANRLQGTFELSNRYEQREA